MSKRGDSDCTANTTASVQASLRALLHSGECLPTASVCCSSHNAVSPCVLQVLGVGSDTGTSVPSVLLFFDRQRYLFNVGEGFQRFCVEHRIKLAKVSSVLTTRTTTEATGGLPGS